MLRRAQNEFINRVLWAWLLAGQRPVQVTSFIRTPADNARVGGAADSQHLIALAVDLVGDTEELATQARALGLVAIDEGSHLHLQLLPAGTARQVGLFPDL